MPEFADASAFFGGRALDLVGVGFFTEVMEAL
jgi:hypothetical protein